MLRSFFTSEEGATAIEYGLLAALLSVVIISSISTLGQNISSNLDTVAVAIDGSDAGGGGRGGRGGGRGGGK